MGLGLSSHFLPGASVAIQQRSAGVVDLSQSILYKLLLSMQGKPEMAILTYLLHEKNTSDGKQRVTQAKKSSNSVTWSKNGEEFLSEVNVIHGNEWSN